MAATAQAGGAVIVSRGEPVRREEVPQATICREAAAGTTGKFYEYRVFGRRRSGPPSAARSNTGAVARDGWAEALLCLVFPATSSVRVLAG